MLAAGLDFRTTAQSPPRNAFALLSVDARRVGLVPFSAGTPWCSACSPPVPAAANHRPQANRSAHFSRVTTADGTFRGRTPMHLPRWKWKRRIARSSTDIAEHGHVLNSYSSCPPGEPRLIGYQLQLQQKRTTSSTDRSGRSLQHSSDQIDFDLG